MDLETIGQYDIVAELGSGGMGIVYKAVHRELKRTVALKVIREKYAGRQDHLDRFKREASVCAALRHPNVITLFDYGEQDGVCFYAMELLEAETLEDWLERHEGRMPVGRLLKVAEAICQAYAYIHERGLVHRDIKPANIMLGRDDHVTLMDFGLVKALQETALTQAGKAIGTPRYMSPEMLRGETVDRRSDIFQLGLVLYEAATGRQPFEGNDIYVLARAILTADPARPSSLVKGLTRHMDALILNCLEKDADDRYQSADEVLADIDRVRRRLPVRLRSEARSTPEGVAAGGDGTATAPSPSPSSRPAQGAGGASSTGGGTAVMTVSRSLGDLGSFSFTDLSGSLDQLRTTLTWRHVLVILALVSFLPLGLVLLCRGNDTPYGMRGFTSVVDLDAVEVAWTSDRPYPTRLLVREAGRTTGAPVEHADRTSGLVTDHRMVVDGLRPGTRYELSVLYPDGTRSLTQTVELPPADRLRITRSSVEWPTTTSVTALWETNVDARSEVTFTVDGRRRTQKLSPTPSRTHRLAVDGLRFGDSLSEAVLGLHSVRHADEVRLGEIPGPGGAVQNLVRELEGFSPAAFLGGGLADTIRQLGLNERGDEARATVLRELEREPSWKLLGRLRPLLPFVFTSPDAGAGTVKGPLYQGLRRLDQIDTHLDWAHLPTVVDVKELFAPWVATTYAREAPALPGTPLKVFTLSEEASTFLPANLEVGTSSGMASGLLKAYQKERQIVTQERLRVDVDMTEFLRSCSERPRLVLRVRNMTPDFYVRVTFNDTWSLDAGNTAASAPPTMWLAVHAEVTAESHPDYSKAVNYVMVTFPRLFLRPGVTTVEVALMLVPSMTSIHFVQLRHLWIYPR